jgi:hypothetical protein
MGQQLHFLIWYKGDLVGIISAVSAVYRNRARDRFFKITDENRDKVLGGLVNNGVFRLERREPNLASRVLALWTQVVPALWKKLYGVDVWGFETFVETGRHPRPGVIYAAAGWTLLNKEEPK